MAVHIALHIAAIAGGHRPSKADQSWSQLHQHGRDAVAVTRPATRHRSWQPELRQEVWVSRTSSRGSMQRGVCSRPCEKAPSPGGPPTNSTGYELNPMHMASRMHDPYMVQCLVFMLDVSGCPAIAPQASRNVQPASLGMEHTVGCSGCPQSCYMQLCSLVGFDW